ncbi:MAG: META domain-containing protein [Rhodomicrobium sp.]
MQGTADKIEPLASTRVACPREMMEAEHAWLQVLDSTHAADASHLKLVLKDDTGAVIATLKHRDWD